MNHIFYIDGKYIKADERLLETFTPGVNKRHGVFETLLVKEGVIELLDEHIARLLEGLTCLKIKHTYTSNYFKRIARLVVKLNELIEIGRLRLLVFKEGRDVHAAAMILPYKPPSPMQYKKGLHVCMVKTNRLNNRRCADVKSLDYGVFAKAYQNAKAKGFDEAILLNCQGHVMESSRGNVFIVKDGQCLTPPLSSGCLNGIMRQQIIANAKNLGKPIIEKSITPAMLKSADQVFLTNSLVGIIPAYFDE